MNVKIIIYEDNEELRNSLVSLLSREKSFTVSGDYPVCEKLTDHLQTLKPDVVLMDIDLPGINGIECVKQIRTFDKEVQIIMITVFDDDTSVYDALYAGANGYLLKKNIFERLTNAIKEVLEGGAPMSPSIARLVINNMMQRREPKLKEDYQLTPREMDVLTSLGKGNSYKMVADDLAISIETVRTHIKHVYHKLHVQSQGEAISRAIREGVIK